jgi:radical SAM superfamily enzyme YgiQ (UPF0313 family)
VKAGHEVEIFDARLHPATWRGELVAKIGSETLLVGISVMSGPPVRYAREIAELCKRADPEVKVVWGGPFATFNPEIILDQDCNTDYVVNGYGAKTLHALVDNLVMGREIKPVPGLFMRGADGKTVGVLADWSCHEVIDYRDIPYHLIPNYTVYGQLDQKRVMFSLYSAMGCPYRCAFCSSPALYKNVKSKRWQPIPVEDVADHIQYLIDVYSAEYIYFIDDDSFVDVDHVEALIDTINRRGISVKLGFRGARINEIKKMSHSFLDKLAAAGTDILHIGAESGSDRLLKMVRKDCTVSDILACNSKLAQHPQIFAFYNFIVGLPTEDMEDLKTTAQLMLKLTNENPKCIISTPNVFRPLQGTELFDIASKQWGFQVPCSLDDWADMEVETEYNLPWVDKAKKRFIHMMLLTSYFVDNKINKMKTGATLLMGVLRIVNNIYRPLARLRLRCGFSGLLVERYVYDMAKRIMLRQTK